MERILRQQDEARFAVEAERLQREKARAEQLAAKPVMPSNAKAETASLLSTETGESAQTLVTPTPATGALSGIFNRHLNLNFQNLKRRAGLIHNDHGHPPPVPEKPLGKHVSGVPSPLPSPSPRPQSPPVQPLVDQSPNDEYVLNQQYLSGAGQSRPPIPVDDGSNAMPGWFPHIGNIINMGTNPRPTPLSDICESRCLPLRISYSLVLLARNIELAIDSCKPESGNLLQNRERMQVVKESVDDGYCDISGRKGNFHNIGMSGFFGAPFRSTDNLPYLSGDGFCQDLSFRRHA